ncbi:MAG: hypothetical protein ACFFDH_00270 [Promethearchaeota archaeon]
MKKLTNKEMLLRIDKLIERLNKIKTSIKDGNGDKYFILIGQQKGNGLDFEQIYRDCSYIESLGILESLRNEVLDKWGNK